jgi:uncharacterized protein
MAEPWRFYVRAPGGKAIFGFELREAAEYAAREYSDGACLVDTLAQAYHPMVETVSAGELIYDSVGGWDTGRFGIDRDLIEAIKKGHPAIVHALLAKGADPDIRDAHGGPALVWAAAGGNPEIVTLLLDHGADREVRDEDGASPTDIALRRGKAEVMAVLQQWSVNL